MVSKQMEDYKRAYIIEQLKKHNINLPTTRNVPYSELKRRLALARAKNE